MRRSRRLRVAVLWLAAVICGGVPLSGQPLPSPLAAPSAAAATGSELAISVITFGPGDVLFERFGHNALWVHDARNGADVAYNWGLYDFAQPAFIRRFLTGDTKYSMGGADANLMLDAYHRLGRTITVQRLALTPQQALALRDFVRWNALDENKFYRYDYFRDNCSTRLRDAIDRVLGGALQQQSTGLTPLSYRSETLRLMNEDRPLQAGMDIALGRPADAPLSHWQSYFIPMRLRDGLRTVRVTGANGVVVPLVSEERVIAPPPGSPAIVEEAVLPALVGRYLAVGIVLAALVVGIRIMMLTRRGAAWGLALFGAAWSLVCGVIGVIILLAWFATRHVFWSWNENLLLLVPLALGLVVLMPASLLSNRFVRAARMLASIIALLGVGALVLALIPGGQQSGAIVALILPVNLAIAWALALPRLTTQRASATPQLA